VGHLSTKLVYTGEIDGKQSTEDVLLDAVQWAILVKPHVPDSPT
jgi:hypothetical protein